MQPYESVHCRYHCHPADLPLAVSRTALRSEIRRFYCCNPSCQRRTFAESLSELLGPRARRTWRLTDQDIIDVLEEVRDLATPVYKAGIPSIPPVRLAGEGGVKRHCDAFVAGVMAYAASRADVMLIEYTPAYRDGGSDLGRPFEAGRRALW